MLPMMRFFIAIAFFAASAYTITTVARLIFQRRSGRGGSLDDRMLEDRLTRLEGAVEGLSAETQKLADGHRFFTQLLANRPPASAIESGRVTPGTNSNSAR
jgi:hypothetical protein